MTGLYDTDVKLSPDWQLTRAADGDAPLCSGEDCLFQNIALEAATQKGDLWYDPSFGWSLYDFIKSEDDELTRLEIVQRTRNELTKRDVIAPDSIEVKTAFVGDVLRLSCAFRFTTEQEPRELDVIIGAVDVEVVTE